MMQTVNLMPPEYQRRRFYLDRARGWGAILVVLVTVLAASAWTLKSGATAIQTQLEDERELLNELTLAQARGDQLKMRQQSIQTQQDVLQRLVVSRGWEEFIREITESTNDGVWIRHLRARRPAEEIDSSAGDEPNAVDASSARLSVELMGFATSNGEFAEFLSRLNQQPLVIHAEAVQLQTGQLLKGMLVEFSVHCEMADPVGMNGVRVRIDTQQPILAVSDLKWPR